MTEAQRQAKVEAGRKGGRSTSAAKAAAVRANGRMPCAPGKSRGGGRKKKDEDEIVAVGAKLIAHSMSAGVDFGSPWADGCAPK